MGYPKIRVNEGAASLLVPELDESTAGHIDRARSLAPVFYNPLMRLNRDSAVLALGVHQGRLGRGISACEPMCGTGIRGVRLALEVKGVEEVVLSDLNIKAVQLATENVSFNGVSDRVAVRHMEANLLLSLHARPLSRFDYVDVDPYGTPAPYLDTAVRACKRGGLIGLTATDMAPLCGVHPRASLRKYGGRSLRTEYCHELAIRLVTGALAVTAARHQVASTPVFSYAADHYVRVYAHLERGKKKADGSLREMGYVLHCFSCGHRRTINKLLRTTRQLTQEYGHEPSYKEIADSLSLTPERVEEIIDLFHHEPVSLETPVGEDEDSRLGDFVEDRASPAPTEVASQQLLKEQVDKVLDELSEREKRVIQLRFGLKDGHPRTLEEVGKEFSVTRERIRQIEAKALRKLRHPQHSRKLRDYLE